MCGYFDNADGNVFYFVTCADTENEELTGVDAVIDTQTYRFGYTLNKETSFVVYVDVFSGTKFKPKQ